MAPKKEQQKQGVKLAIRQAGEGGITKQELNNITKSTGANAQTVIRRLDQVNQNLKSNDSARIGLNSGAANMLIKQNSNNPVGMFNQGKGYGTGQIGKTLSSMMGTPAVPGAMIKGQMVGGRAAQPGFNPGGNPNKNRMIGGTQIRGGGNIAVRGFGQQYELPKTKILNPIDLETGSNRPSDTTTTPTTVTTTPTDQIPQDLEVTSTDLGAGMMAGGGMGSAGASRLTRAKSRLKKLGITGNTANQMGRGNVYRNLINMF